MTLIDNNDNTEWALSDFIEYICSGYPDENNVYPTEDEVKRNILKYASELNFTILIK